MKWKMMCIVWLVCMSSWAQQYQLADILEDIYVPETTLGEETETKNVLTYSTFFELIA